MDNYQIPIERFLDIASAMLQAEAVREAPRVTQRLAGDITIFPAQIGQRTVGNTALIDYARYVHNGTRPYVIRPKRKKALRTPYGIFKKVNHPGISANPYLDRALRNLAGSGRLATLLDTFAGDMSEEIFNNLSQGLRNIR